MSAITPTLPLNTFVTEKFLSNGLKFSDKTILVAVQHLLDDTLDMYKGVIALGIPAQQIFTLGKHYSNIPRVVKEMQKLGINVIPTTSVPIGAFYPMFQADIQKLWDVVEHYLQENTEIERIIVLDDGGLLITSMPAHLHKNYIVCGEEQTTSGLYTFEKKQPAFDVVSEASSAVKLLIESPLFTRAAVERVIERAQETVDFSGKKVGVIGMGSIGTSLAVYLHRLGAEVYGFDVTPKKAYSLPDDVSVISASSLQEIINTCEYCFGCTGRDIFEGLELGTLKHHPKLILASVSSGDREFLSLIRYILTKEYSFDKRTKDIRYKTLYGSITILQQGFPINFDGKQGSADPVKTQLTTAMLLGGLMQAYIRCSSNQEIDFHTVLMHSPKMQKRLLLSWFTLLPEMKELYAPNILEQIDSEEWYLENSTGLRATDTVLSRIF